MRCFENFILEIPYLLLSRVFYLWIPIVAFWMWPPYISGVLILILLIGLGLMLFQEYAWEQRIKRVHNVIFKDHPQALFWHRARNLSLLLTGCSLLGWLFNGQFGLNGVQWAVLLAGIIISYRVHAPFGHGVVYLITDKGIAIRYVPGNVDFRLLFEYDEIKKVVHVHDMSKDDRTWNVLSPTGHLDEGLLLVPCNPDGFSKQINNVMIAPANLEAFLKHLPKRLTNSSQGF